MFKIYASCDPVYLKEHAPALIASCAHHGNNLEINCINGSLDEEAFLLDARKRFNVIKRHWNTEFQFTLKEQFTKTEIVRKSPRTIFACDRFVTVGSKLRFGTDSYLIVDVDCFLMKHISEPESDIGIFLREPLPGTIGWEAEGSKVAAGAVYYSPKAYEFAEDVVLNILRGPYQWFLDQKALNEAYQKHKDRYSYTYFDKAFMDWEFESNTSIWTGKGSRKYDNPKYVDIKNYLTMIYSQAKI